MNWPNYSGWVKTLQKRGICWRIASLHTCTQHTFSVQRNRWFKVEDKGEMGMGRSCSMLNAEWNGGTRQEEAQVEKDERRGISRNKQLENVRRRAICGDGIMQLAALFKGGADLWMERVGPSISKNAACQSFSNYFWLKCRKMHCKDKRQKSISAKLSSRKEKWRNEPVSLEDAETIQSWEMAEK